MPRNQTNPSAFVDTLIAAASGERRRGPVLSDSQWAHTTNRLQYGWRNRVEVPHFSWTGHAAATGNGVLCGYNGNGARANAIYAAHAPDTATPYTGTNLFEPGSVGISPDSWSERQYDGTDLVEDAGAALFSFYASSGSSNSVTAQNYFARFRAGSWLSPDFKCRLITYFNSATQTAALNCYAYRNGSAKPKAIHNSTNWTPAGTSTGIKYQDFDCDGNSSDEPWLRMFPAAGVTEGDYAVNAAASSTAVLGCVFESKSRPGLGMTFLSNSGWSAEAHTLTTVCSDANLGSYLNAVGVPDFVILQIGHNLTTNEVSGGVLQAQWKTNVAAIITRYNARFAALGKTNTVWLLVTPWYIADSGGYADSVMNDEAQAMHEIARDTSSGLVGHVNLSALCGSGASLVAAGYLGAADIHPQSEAATDFFVDKILEGAFGSGASRFRSPRKGLGR